MKRVVKRKNTTCSFWAAERRASFFRGRWKKGDEGGSYRAKICGRFLPQHRLSSEQEHHPQRKGRIVLQAERGVRNHQRRLENQHGRRAGTKKENGGRPRACAYR